MSIPFPQDNVIAPSGRFTLSWQRFMQFISSQVGDVVAYTPSVYSYNGAITTATASARYQKIGKQVFLTGTVQVTNNGTGSGQLLVGLPNDSSLYAPYIAVGSGSQGGTIGASGKAVQVAIGGQPLGPSGNQVLPTIAISNTDGTYPTAGPIIYFTVAYEVR